MCSMLANKANPDKALTPVQQKLVRELFLAGGVSFNNAKESKEASRRIELRMQFYGLKDDRMAQPQPVFDITKEEVCQVR